MLKICGNTFSLKRRFWKEAKCLDKGDASSIFLVLLCERLKKQSPSTCFICKQFVFIFFFSWRKKNYKNLQGIRGGGVRFSLWTANILLPFCWAASLIRLCCTFRKGIRTGSYLCFWILLDTGSPQLKTPPSISIRNDKDCRGMCCFFFVSIAVYAFGPGHAW